MKSQKLFLPSSLQRLMQSQADTIIAKPIDSKHRVWKIIEGRFPILQQNRLAALW